MPFYWAHSARWTDTWIVWPSSSSITFWLLRTEIYFRKWFSEYFLNSIPSDQPVSLIVRAAPTAAPCKSSARIICLGNTKQGGSAKPAALPHPKMVMVLPFPEVSGQRWLQCIKNKVGLISKIVKILWHTCRCHLGSGKLKSSWLQNHHFKPTWQTTSYPFDGEWLLLDFSTQYI